MKRLFSLTLLWIAAVTVWAQQISEEQARERVVQYLHQSSKAFARGKTLAGENLDHGDF